MPESIAFTGDIHLSHTIWELYRQITGDSRVALNQIAEAVTSRGIKHLVIAGDLFNSTDPHPALVERFREFAETLSTAGTDLWFIQGNHDRRVVPWARAVSGHTKWIGDGVPVEIGGRTVVGFDYAPRDVTATNLAKAGTLGDIDILVLHQFAKQYIGAETSWNLDLEWVPDNVRDVVMGDIHEPWSKLVGTHRCWYTMAPQTRSITEAPHPKSILVLDEAGEWNRVGIASRRIKAWSITAENHESTLSEIRTWLTDAAESSAATGLPPVVYLTYDDTLPSAVELTEELIKAMRVDAFIVSRGTLTRVNPGIRPGDPKTDIPGPGDFLARCISEGSPAFALALDLITSEPGKASIAAKLEHARNLALQEPSHEH